MDVCGFILRQVTGRRYSLLTAGVLPLGTIILHHERIQAILRAYESKAQELRDDHDPLTPVVEDIEQYLLSKEQILGEVKKAESQLNKQRYYMVRGMVSDLKQKRAQLEKVWNKKERLPILLIGGGSKSPFFRLLAEEFSDLVKSQTVNGGAVLLPVPKPRSLKGEISDYHRLAVAWGLSHRALDVGEIIPRDRIEDMPPLPRREYRDNYISKDQV